MGRSIAVNESLCDVWGKSASQHHSFPTVSEPLLAGRCSFILLRQRRHLWRRPRVVLCRACGFSRPTGTTLEVRLQVAVYGNKPVYHFGYDALLLLQKLTGLTVGLEKKGYNFSFIIRIELECNGPEKIFIYLYLFIYIFIFCWKYYIYKWTPLLGYNNSKQI